MTIINKFSEIHWEMEQELETFDPDMHSEGQIKDMNKFILDNEVLI